MTTLQLQCPSCGSGWVVTKANGTIRVCRKCGHEGPALDFEAKGESPNG